MSHLAASLGNPREIAQLARAAQEGARGQVTPRAQAMFYAAEARGHALLGDAPGLPGGGRAGGRRRWSAAERRDRATTRPGSPTSTTPIWPTNWRTATATWGRPGPPAQRAEEALAGHPEGRARRRAIGLLLLADAQVQQREVEQACHTGTQAVELLGGLRSDRGAEYLEDFRRRLEPYARRAGGAGVQRPAGAARPRRNGRIPPDVTGI